MGHFPGSVLDKFRRAPTPALACIVGSRFIFGFGLGALLAATSRGNWKRVGWLSMLAAILIALPAAVTILRGAK